MNLFKAILHPVHFVRAVWRKPICGALAPALANPKADESCLPVDFRPEPPAVAVPDATQAAPGSATDILAAPAPALDPIAEWAKALPPAVRMKLPCDDNDGHVALRRMYDLCENLPGPVATSLEQFVVLVPDWQTMCFKFARLLLRHLHWAVRNGRAPSVHWRRVRNHLRGCRSWPVGLALNWPNAEAAALGHDAERDVASRDWSYADHGRDRHGALRHGAG